MNEHGTKSGYNRHKRRGEVACFECRVAYAEWFRAYRARLKERAA